MPTDLDRRLAAFLDVTESERDLGVTGAALKASLDRIANQQVQHDGEDQERHKEVLSLIKGHDFRIGNLERREKPPTHGGARDPDSSYHDFDAELKEARAILLRRVRDVADPLDEAKAKAIAEQTVLNARAHDKAAQFDDAQKRSVTRRDGIAITVAAGIVLMIAGILAGHFEGRATATPQTAGVHP